MHLSKLDNRTHDQATSVAGSAIAATDHNDKYLWPIERNQSCTGGTSRVELNFRDRV